MRSSLIRFRLGAGVVLVVPVVLVVLVASACRQGDPSIEPKTPPNSPVPTKIDRPDDPPASPSMPKLTPDGGASR